MKKHWKLSIIMLCAVALGIFTAGALQAATELAKINSRTITLEEFNKRYQENMKFFQFKAPSRVSVLEELIKRELAVQEAKKMGLDRDPEIQERMNTVLYHALLEKQLSKEFEKIHITDAQAKDFYARNPEIRTSHLFVALAPNAKPEEEKNALERMRKMDAMVKAGKMGFAEIAQKFSDGAAAPMGGDIDFQTKDKLDPAYYDTAVKLRSKGRVSGITRTQFGYHIIKLTDIRSWENVDKAAVKRLLFDQRRNDIFEKYMKELRAQAKVSVNSGLLKD